MPSLWEQAQECEERRAWKEALSYYQTMMALEPNNPVVLHRKIRCLFQMGEGNLSLLEDAAKSFPDFELFHRDCVAILLHEGKKEQALERANRNILNFNGNYDMWIDCGAVYSRMGQYKRAEESYRMALSLQPNAQDAWFNWANMLLERQQYAQAEEHY
ncbi:MAG: tetratricopeptide repeat protein, partial [Myxococcota bacterium]|nr:tetratricopeptide repeat protein [Myxococcota bacterium]